MDAEKSKYYRDIREKRRILREAYGGLMTIADLTRELGYCDRKSACRAAEALGLEMTRIGRYKRYDTDLVARALVDGRGMV